MSHSNDPALLLAQITRGTDQPVGIPVTDDLCDKLSQAHSFAKQNSASVIRFEWDCDWPESSDASADLVQAIMSEVSIEFGPTGECLGVRAVCEDRYSDAPFASEFIELRRILEYRGA